MFFCHFFSFVLCCCWCCSCFFSGLCLCHSFSWHKKNIYWSYFYVYLFKRSATPYCFHYCLLLFFVRSNFSFRVPLIRIISLLFCISDDWLLQSSPYIHTHTQYTHNKYNNLWWFKACKQHVWTFVRVARI